MPALHLPAMPQKSIVFHTNFVLKSQRRCLSTDTLRCWLSIVIHQPDITIMSTISTVVLQSLSEQNANYKFSVSHWACPTLQWAWSTLVGCAVHVEDGGDVMSWAMAGWVHVYIIIRYRVRVRVDAARAEPWLSRGWPSTGARSGDINIYLHAKLMV